MRVECNRERLWEYLYAWNNKILQTRNRVCVSSYSVEGIVLRYYCGPYWKIIRRGNIERPIFQWLFNNLYANCGRWRGRKVGLVTTGMRTNINISPPSSNTRGYFNPNWSFSTPHGKWYVLHHGNWQSLRDADTSDTPQSKLEAVCVWCA